MRLFRLGALWLASLAFCLGALAAEFKLITGDLYKGTLAAADRDGLVIKLDSGDFSPRIDWAKLTDETLNLLVSDPRAKQFVEPFIEPPPEEIARPQERDIPVRQPQRVERPEGRKGLVAALMTPNGLMLLLALYAANLYGAFEIARFKWRPVALVCGLSAVLPVVGPIIFLVIPRNVPVEQENATEAALAQTQVSVGGGSPAPSASDAPRSGAASALGLAKAQAGGGAQEGLPKVFKRGETTFNRRFFETQFPSFFRVVATEADRDLVLDVSAGKSSVIAARISRISANEVHFKSVTNQEIGATFGEISQVTLRHKD